MLGMLIPEKLSPKLDQANASHRLAPSLSSQAINKDKKRFLRLQKKINKIKKRLDDNETTDVGHMGRRGLSSDFTNVNDLKLVPENTTERLPQLAQRNQSSERSAALMQRSFSSADIVKVPIKRTLRSKPKEGSSTRVDEMSNTKSSTKNGMAQQMVVDMR